MTLPPHVPETDFGNIPAPVGWIVGPCGQFHPNPASEVNGPGSVAWSIPCYTESSMRAYATAAVLAERARCIAIVEKWRDAYPSEDGTRDALDDLRSAV